ncbi:MAG: Hsp20/alpha crystallin family protein, partial [Treponema sp.]|nr:Hsp20/alpha crystallin family protein [Treponema sp.]
LKERRVSSFERNFTLPSDVDSDSITANFKNGILTVTMQKREIEKPKRIEIAAS